VLTLRQAQDERICISQFEHIISAQSLNRPPAEYRAPGQNRRPYYMRGADAHSRGNLEIAVRLIVILRPVEVILDPDFAFIGCR
jgi:hypothetical protein